MPCSAGRSAPTCSTTSSTGPAPVRIKRGNRHDHRHHLYRDPRGPRVPARRERLADARRPGQDRRSADAHRSGRSAPDRDPDARQRHRVHPGPDRPVPARGRAQPGRRGDPADRRRHARPAAARRRPAHRPEPGVAGARPGHWCRWDVRVRGGARGGGRLHPVMSAVPLRRYLIGQLPSVTCSWAQVVALSWVVVERNPHALGWVTALQFLPSLVLGPWFGAVTDRHDRRRLLMLAEAGLGLVALTYAVVSAVDALTLPWIVLLATAWGVVNALDTPARRALIPMLVPAEQATRASALAGTVMLTGMTRAEEHTSELQSRR